MPLNIADLRKKTKPFRFDYELDDRTEVVTGRYTPNGVTAGLQRQLQKAAPEEQPEAMANLLSAILVSWDFTGEDGHPYPIESEALMGLGLDFLSGVVTACTADTAPGESNAVSSDNGSSQEAALASALNGTAIGY